MARDRGEAVRGCGPTVTVGPGPGAAAEENQAVPGDDSPTRTVTVTVASRLGPCIRQAYYDHDVSSTTIIGSCIMISVHSVTGKTL